MVSIGPPDAETPRPGGTWSIPSDKDRVAAAAETLVEHGWAGIATVVSAVPSGTVTIRWETDIPAAERGKAARAMEADLQARWGKGVTLSALPAVDRNALRKLRGVDIL